MCFHVTGTEIVATQLLSFNDVWADHTLKAKSASRLFTTEMDVGGKNVHV